MTLTLPDDLSQELRRLAEEQNRTPEALLRELLAREAQGTAATPPSAPDIAPTPSKPSPEALRRVFLSDEMRRFRDYVYAQARAYWRETNNSERLQLTDADLDAQFDFINADGVPVLKSDPEAGTPSPLAHLAGIFTDDVTDLSTTVEETMREFYQRKYGDTD